MLSQPARWIRARLVPLVSGVGAGAGQGVESTGVPGHGRPGPGRRGRDVGAGTQGQGACSPYTDSNRPATMWNSMPFPSHGPITDPGSAP